MSTQQKLHQFSILCILISSFAHFADSKTFELDISREFFSQSGKSLQIETGAGDISVKAGNDDSTRIQVKLAVSAGSQEKADELFQRIEVDIAETGSGVQVRVLNSHTSSFWSWIFRRKAPTVEVYAVCPQYSDLNLDTGSGNILVSNVEGEIVLDTGSGDVSANELGGSVVADTGSGNVSINALNGNFTGDTGSGDIRVTGLNGNFDGEAGSGNIQARGQISSFTAATGSGDVTIETTLNNPDPSKVATGSGNIDLYLPISANAQFIGSTSSGKIRAEFPNANFQSVSENSVDIILNSGGPQISARAGSGNVSLYPAAPQLD